MSGNEDRLAELVRQAENDGLYDVPIERWVDALKQSRPRSVNAPNPNRFDRSLRDRIATVVGVVLPGISRELCEDVAGVVINLLADLASQDDLLKAVDRIGQ